ncbi:MAG: hypothetical protein ABF338_12215, partial [Hyphomonas sp.]
MREGLALLAGRGNVEPVGGDSGCGGNVRGGGGRARATPNPTTECLPQARTVGIAPRHAPY